MPNEVGMPDSALFQYICLHQCAFATMRPNGSTWLLEDVMFA